MPQRHDDFSELSAASHGRLHSVNLKYPNLKSLTPSQPAEEGVPSKKLKN